MKDIVDFALLELVDFKEDEFGNMDKLSFLQEFRTISLGLPRRTGKTHKLLNYVDESSILIVPQGNYDEFPAIVRNFNNILCFRCF